MTSTHAALEGLLELCDQIRDLQERSLREPETRATGVAEPLRARVAELRQQVFRGLPGLSASPRGQALSDAELLVLALLFHRRVLGLADPAPAGELVALLSQAGFGRTDSLKVLGPRALLRRDGWLHAHAEGRVADPLDVRFQLAPEATELFWTVEDEAPAAAEDGTPPVPYGSEEECLWDLHAWRVLCLQRAEALLDGDNAGSAMPPRLRGLRREARAGLLRIRGRLAATIGGSEYRIERFRRQHHLSTDELLLVVHLLFCELVEGAPYVAALECLRVIAESRSDLFRKRRVVGPKGRLRQTGILVGREENSEYTKALATELCLADWAADEITAGATRPPRLDDRELDDLLRGDE
ncbi:MAG: hypothetical protein EYC70_08985 [Planctomycetota bacterium]|nr:MAG: hypothetical protein EYC70_08985 [Planctomycetota bacterium]